VEKIHPKSSPDPVRRRLQAGLSKELLLFAPVYFFLSFINLCVKLWETPAWFDGTLVRNHLSLLQFQFTNNEQSRILQYLIPEILRRIFDFSIESAYILQRFVFVFLAFVLFHGYLRKWFSASASFAGVLFLAACMPLTSLIDLQESAPLLMVLFLLALWAVRDHKDFLFAGFLWLGSVTNETILILSSVYFFYHFTWAGPIPARLRDGLRLAGRTGLLSLPAFLTAAIIRYITRDTPHLGGALHWNDNLAGILGTFQMEVVDLFTARYVFGFFLFSVFWLYAILAYRKCPRFLQRAAWMVPLFILAHMITGIISESRQMIPLGYVVIPMALFFLFPRQDPLQEAVSDEASPV